MVRFFENLPIRQRILLGVAVPIFGLMILNAVLISRELSIATIVMRLTAYIYLTHEIEQAGQERAIGAGGFMAQSFDAARLRRFVSLIATQETLSGAVLSLASEQTRNAMKGVLSSPETAEVDRLRGLAAGPDAAKVAASDWFAAASKRIDLIRTVRDGMSAELMNAAQSNNSSAQKQLYWLLAGLAVLLGASAISAAVEEQRAATQEIARNVQQAADGAQQVTDNIQGVSEVAESTGRVATTVLAASQTLSREAEQMKNIVGKFLHDVRTA